MSDTTVERVAKAIADAQIRGWNGNWVLARVAVVAMLKGAPSHVKQWVEDETTAKSMARLKRYRQGAKKGWDTRRKRRSRATGPDAGENVGEAA